VNLSGVTQRKGGQTGAERGQNVQCRDAPPHTIIPQGLIGRGVVLEIFTTAAQMNVFNLDAALDTNFSSFQKAFLFSDIRVTDGAFVHFFLRPVEV